MAAQFGNVPDAQGGRRPPQQARKLRPGPFTWSDDSEEGKNRLPLVTSSMIRKESAPRSREASEERHTSVQRNQRSVPGSAAANSSELWDSSGWPGYLSGQDTDHNLRPLFDDSLDDVTSNEDTLFIREVRYGDDRPQPVTEWYFTQHIQPRMFVEAPRQLRRPFQRRFECLDCNLEDPTVDDRGLSNHAKTHRWCQQCAKYFRSMQDRDEHLQTCVVVCKTCGFPQHNARAQCQAYFKPYVKAVTQKLVRCREPGCQALGSDPVPPHLLKLHIKEKLELFEFFCEWPMCGQGFVQKRDLIKHIDSHEAGAGSPSPPVDDQHYSQARLYCRGYSISGLPCIMKTHRMDSLRKHERRNRHWGNPEEKEAALHGAKEKKAQRNHEPSVSLQDARRAQAPAVFRESDDDSDWRSQSAPRRSRLLLRRRAKSRPQYHEAETERSSSPYHGKPETGEQSPPPRIKKTTRRKRQRVPSEECDKNDAEHPENLPSGRLKDRRATSQKYDEPETLPSSRSRRAQAHSALQRCEACLSRPAEQRAPAFTLEQQMCYDHDNSLLCSECPMEFVRALNRKNGKRQVSCLICEKLGKRR